MSDAMLSAFGGMDERCPNCGGVIGDHTLRSYMACTVARGMAEDRPYAEVQPQDAVAAVMDGVRERFNIGGDVIVADHVQASAVLAVGDAGPLTVNSPGVLHEFMVGLPTGPAPVAKVLYLGGNVQAMRSYGRLLRDTANGAANAAERAQQR